MLSCPEDVPIEELAASVPKPPRPNVPIVAPVPKPTKPDVPAEELVAPVPQPTKPSVPAEDLVAPVPKPTKPDVPAEELVAPVSKPTKPSVPAEEPNVPAEELVPDAPVPKPTKPRVPIEELPKRTKPNVPTEELVAPVPKPTLANVSEAGTEKPTEPTLCNDLVEEAAVEELSPVPEDASMQEASESALESEEFLTRAQQDTMFPGSKKGTKKKAKAKAKSKGKPKSSAKPKGKAAMKRPSCAKDPKPKAKAKSKSKGRPRKVTLAQNDEQPVQDRPNQDESEIETPPSKRDRSAVDASSPDEPKPQAKRRSRPSGPRPVREITVDQSWTHSMIVPYWSKNHVGLKMRGTGSQALKGLSSCTVTMVYMSYA